MEKKALGKSGLEVSKICLGSMTWGRQNSEADAHEQLDYAVANGVNFIDTAEMYAVPASEESQGLTEQYIGTWINKNQSKRKDIVLATKVTGPSGMSYISDLPLGFSKERIHEAVELSLKRLQTDYIDLYQLHWPERKSNMFGERDYTHFAGWDDNFRSILETLALLQKEGKIRHYGLSNETPWGVMKTANYADQLGVHRFVSIQNAYNLLNRTFEHNLSEVALREEIPLLSYSPLAMGILTGKYANGAKPEKARLSFFDYPRYRSQQVHLAAAEYQKIADDLSISLTQMSLAFVNDRPFLASNIIGATTMDQLKENIASAEILLDKETIARINSVHNMIPNPAP